MQMNFVGKNIHPQPIDDPKHVSLHDILSPYRLLISFMQSVNSFQHS